jgi:lysyl-tRNA synthetase class 2
MIQDVERLMADLADNMGMGTVVSYRGQDIDVSLPWPQTTVRDAFLHAAGWDPIAEPDSLRFDTDLVTKVLPGFDQSRPAVLIDYPAAMASLARLKPGAADVAERGEVFIGGLEIANIYSELNDVREQERRFNEEIEEIRRERGQSMAVPRQFLDALASLPECGGVALGIDRLVMLLCDTDSIDDVIPFTVDTA